jgi:5,10-methylenetetrahydrofolate reductase
VPDEIIERMDSTEKPKEEGMAICAEAIKELQKLSRGIHLMPIGKHNNTPTILEMADIRKKR